jgi:hypothetical protein
MRRPPLCLASAALFLRFSLSGPGTLHASRRLGQCPKLMPQNNLQPIGQSVSSAAGYLLERTLYFAPPSGTSIHTESGVSFSSFRLGIVDVLPTVPFEHRN